MSQIMKKKEWKKKDEWKERSRPPLFTANIITVQYPFVIVQVSQIFGTSNRVKISLFLA